MVGLLLGYMGNGWAMGELLVSYAWAIATLGWLWAVGSGTLWVGYG